MLWLWILGILLALILLICMTRVGILGTIRDGDWTLNAVIGPFRFRLFPSAGKKKEPKKKPATEEASKPEKKKKPLPRFTYADGKELLHALWLPLKRALRRTRRSIRLHPLNLSLTVGGSGDPAEAAQRYGELHAAVWTFMPALEQLIVVPDPHIHVGIDFDRDSWLTEGSFGVSVRIGTLLAVGFSLAIPALRWFLRFQKKAQRPAEPAAAHKKG